MIEHICGELVRKEPESVVVRVGGIGFQAQIPTGSFATAKVGEELTILTSLVVRQDALSFFGFQTATERQFFTLLTGISGIGPKSALGILSHATPGQLADAILREDISTLTKVKGIGKKGARRIILELNEKIKALKPEGSTAAQLKLPASSAAIEEARDVLLSLGCTEDEAQAAIDVAQKNLDLDSEGASEILVMEALQALSPPSSN